MGFTRDYPKIYPGPRSPMAETEDLKSSQCGFDPHSGHSAI